MCPTAQSCQVGAAWLGSTANTASQYPFHPTTLAELPPPSANAHTQTIRKLHSPTPPRRARAPPPPEFHLHRNHRETERSFFPPRCFGCRGRFRTRSDRYRALCSLYRCNTLKKKLLFKTETARADRNQFRIEVKTLRHHPVVAHPCLLFVRQAKRIAKLQNLFIMTCVTI